MGSGRREGIVAEKLLVNVSEAASMVSIGRSTAYALVAKGEWPIVKVGRTCKVPVAALRKWVRRQTRSDLALPNG
jgi:excisionase family DNA binding protein